MMKMSRPLHPGHAPEGDDTTGARGTSLHRLIYVSRSLLAGPSREIEAGILNILEASRHNNARAGITGALLFSADSFAQALEGPLPAVQQVFERIQCDERHRDTVVLACDPVAAREFGAWSMAWAGQVESGRYSSLTMPSAAGTEAQRVLELLRRVLRPVHAG